MSRVTKADGTRISVSTGTKGAISEHLATAWLLSQGFDVFRNVSPNGRADLLAVDWANGETIRVDVKSQAYGAGPGRAHQSARREVNAGFDIRYLVVSDDGSCGWYSETPEPANDNEPRVKWFVDGKTDQRFLAPGFDMSRKDWAYFCHWLLRAYPDFIVPFSEMFVRSISARSIGSDRVEINSREMETLEKLRRSIFQKMQDAGAKLILESAA